MFSGALGNRTVGGDNNIRLIASDSMPSINRRLHLIRSGRGEFHRPLPVSESAEAGRSVRSFRRDGRTLGFRKLAA